MTGTALYNDLQDIIGPLSLMWHSLGIEWNFEQSDLGHLAGLYHPEYDPFAKTNEVSFAGVRLVTKGLFYEYSQSNIALLEMHKCFVNSYNSVRTWMLHPGLQLTRVVSGISLRSYP